MRVRVTTTYEAWFVLDTGASGSTIATTLARRLGLPASGEGRVHAFDGATDTKIHVHVYGDTATINARTFGDRVEQGKTVPNRVRYMRVWMKREGQWRAIAQMARPLESQ